MIEGSRSFVSGMAALAVGLFVLMVVVILFTLTVEPKAGGEIAPEVVRSAIGVILVGILGSMLTFVIRQHSASQEEDRRLDEYRMRQLLDLVGAYNETKAVRRALRAAGFAEAGMRSFAPWQADEFRRQMALLSGAELAMEKTKRELRANLGRLTRLDEINNALLAVEDYLQTIIKEWEGGAVRVAIEPVDTRAALPNLSGFLLGAEEEDKATFRLFVSTRMRFIQDCIRLDMAKGEKSPQRKLQDPEPPEPPPAVAAAR
jgi:hypothetical protein